jgi:hypothetical protein
MPKAVKLAPDMIATKPLPAAATAPRTPRAGTPRPEPTMPLQLRLPRDEVRRIKIAAAEREQTISQFMLACVHANMQSA